MHIIRSDVTINIDIVANVNIHIGVDGIVNVVLNIGVASRRVNNNVIIYVIDSNWFCLWTDHDLICLLMFILFCWASLASLNYRGGPHIVEQ